ncbi:hypothetical protein E4U43_005504 [Claviceps pusilla]|uniref:Uncharacterized protein n=1 Tax=Claviceps pusilla TaxID=123648 RepID=A0A9P7N4S2_9HYPO|nr:hypothetical protein E4U43_005504 [Claviceps pusilla]
MKPCSRCGWANSRRRCGATTLRGCVCVVYADGLSRRRGARLAWEAALLEAAEEEASGQDDDAYCASGVSACRDECDGSGCDDEEEYAAALGEADGDAPRAGVGAVSCPPRRCHASASASALASTLASAPPSAPPSPPPSPSRAVRPEPSAPLIRLGPLRLVQSTAVPAWCLPPSPPPSPTWRPHLATQELSSACSRG